MNKIYKLNKNYSSFENELEKTYEKINENNEEILFINTIGEYLLITTKKKGLKENVKNKKILND